MSKIKITCDSTCDLTPELYARYDITPMALGVCMGEDVRQDCVDVTAQELYDYVSRTGQLPTTTAPSVGAYEDLFRRFTEQGDEVIHISLSSHLSSSNQNACIAAEEVGNVFVVDSLALSTGSGHLVLLAAELRAAGYTAKEIAAALDSMKKKVDVSFVLQTLNYLHKGGRCSGVAVFGANLMNIRPEIQMTDGKLHVGKKYRGNMEKSILAYVRGRLEGREDVQTDRIFITHSGVPEEMIEKVVALVKELHPFDQVYVTTAGSTISCHCGPNCLGVLFMKK